MCSDSLQLRCIGTERCSRSNHIIPYTHYLVAKETCINLYGVAFFKSLGSDLFLHLGSMNGRPLSRHLDMRKAIDGTRQLTYKCGKCLVPFLVTLLAAGRDA